MSTSANKITLHTRPIVRNIRQLACQLVNRRSWPSRLELQSAVFEYIEAFYNRERRHSTLGMRSPAAYEQLRLSPLGG